MNERRLKELSFKEIIEILTDWFWFLLSKWKIISVAIFIAIIAGFIFAYTSKKKYVARLTFALEEKGGLNTYAALASQFGIDLGTTSSGAFMGDNLFEVIKSRLIIEKTLLTPVVIGNKLDLLVNHSPEFNKLKSTYENDSVWFKIGTPRSSYTRAQDSLLFRIQIAIAQKGIIINRFDKRLNLVYIEFKSEDEVFAKHFVENLITNASVFYIETKTQKLRTNVATLQRKIDSVRTELNELLYTSAASQDKNLNLVRATNKVSLVQSQIDIQLLTAVYIELSKNFEIASYSLIKDEPLVQIIDRPILPLKFEKPGKLFSMAIFGIVSGMLTAIGLILWRIFKHEIRE